MDKILNLDNVDQYNQLYGIETLHPLVTACVSTNGSLSRAAKAIGTY